MKRLLLLTAILLTACGPSPKEKQEIATITCNILDATEKMDGAARIKEINFARTRMGESAFLLSDDAIQESFKYELCEELVLNISNYDELLKAREKEAEIKLKKSIGGVWFHKNNNDDSSKNHVVTAEFLNEKLIITTYDQDKEFNHRKSHMMFNFRAIDYTRFEIFGNKSVPDDFIAILDKESNSLSMSSLELTNGRNEIKFKRPGNITKKDLYGSWLNHHQEDDYESYQLIKRNESSYVFETLDFHHDKKTYSSSIATCEENFTQGFILAEKCDDSDGYYFYFIASADQNSLNLVFLDSDDAQDQRVSADYKLPYPPKGYTDTAK